MKAHDAGDVFAQIIAALAAGLAVAAGQRAVGHHAVAHLARGDIAADRNNLARRLDTDDQRQLALGKRHAAPAPDVDVVETDGLDAQLHFAGRRSRGRGDVEQLDLAVADQSERTHAPSLPSPACGGGKGGGGRAVAHDRVRGAGHAGSRVMTRQTFWPPKPNELEMARRTFASRALFGTTSSVIAGSGTL